MTKRLRTTQNSRIADILRRLEAVERDRINTEKINDELAIIGSTQRINGQQALLSLDKLERVQRVHYGTTESLLTEHYEDIQWLKNEIEEHEHKLEHHIDRLDQYEADIEDLANTITYQDIQNKELGKTIDILQNCIKTRDIQIDELFKRIEKLETNKNNNESQEF